MATFNLNTPNIPDEADILTQVRQIRSYITNLNNQLRYDLSNIDEDNLTGGELPENAISKGFRQKVHDLQGNMSVFEQTATRILARVENAEGDISSLEQTATGLISSVNNLNAKNRTYVNDTAPSSDLVTGDLWIDTANGNILKRWNGSAWVAVQDGAISIAQQQADKIQWLVASGTSAANMTLTSQLYSLMAANIDLSANNSIKLAVSGGVNLVPNSDFRKNQLSNGWYGWSPTVISRFSSRDAILWQASESAATGICSPLLSEIPKTGDVWTISFECAVSQAKRMDYCFIMGSGGESNWNIGSISPEMPAEQYGFRKYTKTITFTKTFENPVGILLGFTGQTAGSVLIRKIQVEKGNMATDWSPAPSDPASGAKTSTVTLNDAGIAMATGAKFTLDAADPASHIAMGKTGYYDTNDGVYLGSDGLAVGDLVTSGAGGLMLRKDGGILGKWLYFLNTTQDDDVIFNLISSRAGGKSARLGLQLSHAEDANTKEDGLIYLIDQTDAMHAYIMMRWNNNNEKHLVFDGVTYRYGAIANSAVFQMRNIAASTAAASGGYNGEMYVRYS